MIPAAVPRCSGAKRRANEPINTEKLPAPEPAAVRMPSVRTNPTVDGRSGVSALPSARTSTPATSTRAAPKRSASAPETGCTAPQTNCPTAIAKLMDTMLTPVDPAIGKRNNPWVWRTPIVTINITAAARVRKSRDFSVSFCIVFFIDAFLARTRQLLSRQSFPASTHPKSGSRPKVAASRSGSA